MFNKNKKLEAILKIYSNEESPTNCDTFNTEIYYEKKGYWIRLFSLYLEVSIKRNSIIEIRFSMNKILILIII